MYVCYLPIPYRMFQLARVGEIPYYLAHKFDLDYEQALNESLQVDFFYEADFDYVDLISSSFKKRLYRRWYAQQDRAKLREYKSILKEFGHGWLTELLNAERSSTES